MSLSIKLIKQYKAMCAQIKTDIFEWYESEIEGYQNLGNTAGVCDL